MNNKFKFSSIMLNKVKRDYLRNIGIDIEVTVVADIQNNTSYHTGKYRYLISRWDTDTHCLVKNYYNDKQFDSYHDAETAAIKEAYELLK